MQGTGKTYEVSGETTEWEDILIKKGIRTKDDILASKGLNPLDFIEKNDPDQQYDEGDKIMTKLQNAEDLDELEDDPDFEDTTILNEYREQRLKQFQEARIRNRFGDVVEITKDEWITQVTEASKSCWVIIHLYQDSVVECRLLEETLILLAKKFKYIKFLKIRSTQAVENWSDKSLPTLFLYHDGTLQSQMLTLNEVHGKSMKPLDLEWWLVKKNVITDSELEEDPRITNDYDSDSRDNHNRKITRAAQYSGERRGAYDDEDDD